MVIEPDGRAPLLDDRVEHDGRAVDERVEVGGRNRQPAQGGHDLLRTPLGGGGLLLDDDPTGGLVHHDEIDEGPADVDGDAGPAGATAGRRSRDRPHPYVNARNPVSVSPITSV